MAGASDSDDLINLILASARAAALTEGVSDRAAATIARAITARVRAIYGGQRVYICAQDRSEREQAVLRDLQSGKPPAEIAKRHNVHRSTVARIRRRASGMGPEEWVL
jgi:DNA-binding NarL/FixJ family response regulator